MGRHEIAFSHTIPNELLLTTLHAEVAKTLNNLMFRSNGNRLKWQMFSIFDGDCEHITVKDRFEITTDDSIVYAFVCLYCIVHN